MFIEDTRLIAFLTFIGCTFLFSHIQLVMKLCSKSIAKGGSVQLYERKQKIDSRWHNREGTKIGLDTGKTFQHIG